MEEKKKKNILWIVFAVCQVLIIALFIIGGSKLWIPCVLLGIVSIVMLVLVPKERASAMGLIFLFFVIDLLAYFAVKRIFFADVLIVHSNETYEKQTMKATYYVTEKNDTVFLSGGAYYVDNQTSKSLEIYTVSYSKYPTYGGGERMTDVIDPHTMKKVSKAPNYVFQSPPNSVSSKSDHATRSAIRFRSER